MGTLRYCPDCGEPVPAAARLCPGCGAALVGRPAEPPPLRRAAWWWWVLVPLAAGLGLAAALLGARLGERRNADPAAAARAALPSVVTIYTYDSEEELVGQGSGFVLEEPDRCVTNFHVLAGATRAEVRLADRRLYDVVRIDGWRAEGDVCAFRIGRLRHGLVEPPVGVTPLRLARGPRPGVGERIAVVGSPEGLENTLSDGLVSAVREEGDQTLLQISAPISPGSSGGPVFDARGEVVGMARMQLSEGQNLNFAIPAADIREVLVRSRALGMAAFEDTVQRAYEAHRARGDSLFAGKRYEDAFEEYDQADRYRPEDAALAFRTAACLARLDEEDDAATYYIRFLRWSDRGDPGRPIARAWLRERGYEFMVPAP